jgi:glycosyltransferase involved in cell wall biosynthesis
MASISLILSTFNEEKNIRSCIESAKEIVDEIILVDGSSTDRTVEIAKEYGAKVTVTNNPPIFLINRQKAMDQATKDWLLQLDADEHATAELLKEIKELINSDKSHDYNGYYIPRKNFFLGRFLMKGGQYPDYQLRLYRRGKAHFILKDVHEQAIIDGKVGHLHQAMLHYPYKDFSFYIKKWERYNNVIATQIGEELEGAWFGKKLYAACMYLFFRPIIWFIMTYGRHKGFVDGWSGFIFSFYSALRFPVSYLIYLGNQKDHGKK